MTSPLPGTRLPSPETEALAWWQARIDAGGYVGLPDALPSAAAVRVLESRDLIVRPQGAWAFVVSKPNSDRASILRANYWPLVAVALTRFGPAAIDRLAALRLYTGDESIRPQLDVQHTASRSNWRREILPGAELVLRAVGTAADSPPHPLLTRNVDVGGTHVSVVAPETLLLSLTVGDVKEATALVVIWLKSLVVGVQPLADAYRLNPRPVLLKRMAHVAADAGNARLANTINTVLSSATRTALPRGVTGVGTSILVPPYVISGTSGREAWLDRYGANFAHAADQLREYLQQFESNTFVANLQDSLGFAREAKREDTYRSTTIEGYRITREEVDAVVAGHAHAGRTPAEIERLMALTGYSRAFDCTLDQVRVARSALSDTTSSRLQVTESLILDTFLELWSPSVDAGVLDASDLRSWRQRAVQINGSNYAPPSKEKLPSLMRLVLERTNEITSSAVARAIFLHWAFVHAHPFVDGNGRVARLLMNAVLCDAGLPWTTIRADERRAYFAALETAHLTTNLRPLADLIGADVARAAESRATWLEDRPTLSEKAHPAL